MRAARIRMRRKRVGPGRRLGVVIGLVLVGFGLAACGSGSPAADPSMSTDGVARDFAKVLSTRATALGDLLTVETAINAISKADSAVLIGSIGTAEDLISTARRQVTLAAPIAARARSDVVSYENALSAFEQDSRSTKVTLDAAQRASIVAVCTQGRAEAEAIRATAAAYAQEWPAYSGLASALGTWEDRNKHGDYASTASGIAAYVDLVDTYRPDLQTGKTAVAGAETGRLRATSATTTAIDALRASIGALADVQAPTPSGSPSESSSSSASVG